MRPTRPSRLDARIWPRRRRFAFTPVLLTQAMFPARSGPACQIIQVATATIRGLVALWVSAPQMAHIADLTGSSPTSAKNRHEAQRLQNATYRRDDCPVFARGSRSSMDVQSSNGRRKARAPAATIFTGRNRLQRMAKLLFYNGHKFTDFTTNPAETLDCRKLGKLLLYH